MLKPQKNWTTQEMQVLERMAARGWQAPQIARWLKRTPSSVRGKAQELGLKLKRGGKGTCPENTAKKCTRLEIAIKCLLEKMDPATRAFCLGSAVKVEPGSERVYYGQFAERKLAA
jgi:hypothetical protein